MKILVVLCFVVLMLGIEAYAKKEARGKGREHVFGDQDQCVFPFTYEGETYNGCTYAGDWTRPWCSHDSTYNGNWSKCKCSAEEESRLNCSGGSTCIPAAEGNRAKCYIPFNPNGGR
ncbi:uncharacterized protein LOC144629868 isoform X1 [Oculina patagonica]